ncbi:integrase, partial (plasmid) [Escherichia coli]
KTSIFSHPVYLFLREFSLQDFRGGSNLKETTCWVERTIQMANYRLISLALTISATAKMTSKTPLT